MGVDYLAHAFVGCKIRNPNITSKRRGCNHKELPFNCCPQCGGPMWTTIDKRHPILEGLEGSDLKICNTTDNNDTFVGIYSVSTGSKDTGMVLLDNFDVKSVKEKLKITLGELWNENEFGLWVILHCSY